MRNLCIAALLWTLSRIVPFPLRERWLEEWRAEMQHGGRRMIVGALPDAWTMKRLARASSRAIRRRPSPFHAFDQDVRYALRGLLGARIFTLSVVASLAVGIAATSAAFVVLHAAAFRSASGVTQQDRLAQVALNRGCGPGCARISNSTPEDYEILRGSLPAVDALSARTSAQVAIRIGNDAYAVLGEVVSTNYFDVIGVRPSLGRGFTADENSGSDAYGAVIGHSLWQRLFGADPGVLGRFIEVAGQQVRIVGVAAPRFRGTLKGTMAPNASYGPEIWLPLALAPSLVPAAPFAGGRALPAVEYRLYYLGRLKPGATLEQARSDASVATARIRAAHPGTHDDAWVQVDDDLAFRPQAAMMAAFMLVPMLVLGIACVNAANLLLARGTERARDIAVRLALGATRWRVVRHLMAESLLLAVLSGAAALPLILWLLTLAESATGMAAPLSAPALIFTSAASLLCALGFGLGPAVRAVRRTATLGSSRVGDQNPSRMRARRALVVVQVALSLGLLATGAQMIGAVQRLFGTTGAVEPERLVLASFDLDQLKLPQPAGEDFYHQLLDRASQIPGVESVALAPRAALWTWSSSIIVWGPDAGPKESGFYLGGNVAGDFTRTVGLRLVAGRAFVPEDAVATPVAAIVSLPFADAMFDGAAVGRPIRVAAEGQGHARSIEARIVGVIEPAVDIGYSKKPLQTVYVARPLEYEPALTLYIRSRVDLDHLAPALRAAAREINPRVPVMEIATLETLTNRRYFEERLMAGALTLLGGIALALATAGLYGLVSFIVTLRERELGIRMALGATSSEILRLVLGQSMRLALIGATLGGGTALVLGAVVHASIVGVPSLDGTLFLAAAGILTVAMVLASAIPARRASRVDPITVLRQE